MSRSRGLFLFVMPVLLFTLSAFSQVALTTQDKAQKIQSGTFDPSQTSTATSPSTQLSLQGTKDNATGKASVGVQVGDWILEAKGSVPVKKGDVEADIASLDGLADKATVDFGSTWVRWRPSASTSDLENVCMARLIDEGKAKSIEEAKKLLRETETSGEPKYPCTLQSMPAGSKYRKEFDEAVHWGTPLLLTARYEFSKEAFKYALPVTFASQTDNHTSYSATAAVGVITNKVGLIQLSYQYQSSFKAQDTKNVCTPVTGSTSSICTNIAVAQPTRAVKNIFQLETRTFFSKSFGVGPIISGDIRTRVASINVPIYFFKAKDGGLNGGLSLAWKSDTNVFTATVFIGDVLTLLAKN